MALYLDLKIWDGRTMKTIGRLEVLRDRGDDPSSEVGNYTVTLGDAGNVIGRIEGFDRNRGAWVLAEGAIKLAGASQKPREG